MNDSLIPLRGSSGNLVQYNYGFEDGQPAIQAYEGSSNNTILNNDLSPNAAPAPEPASLVLWASIGLGLLGYRRHRRKSASAAVC